MPEISIIHKGADNSQLKKIDFGTKNIITPTYFASLTSASTRTSLSQLLTTFLEHDYTKLLISGYDVCNSFGEVKDETIKLLNDFSKNKKFLFLDSGLFELDTFKKDNWNISNYENTVSEINSDFYASFDVFAKYDENISEIFQEMKENTEKSFNLQSKNQCITICHGKNVNDICSLIENLNTVNPNFLSMIAVSERDIRKNIIVLYRGIKKIRNVLDKINPKCILHVLGCGDPVSIAILSYAGADTFDAVDWNRWLIDRKTLMFTNLNQLPLLSCSCSTCSESKIKAEELVYRHNLTFYHDFIFDLQESIYNDVDLLTFLKKWGVDQDRLSKIEENFYA